MNEVRREMPASEEAEQHVLACCLIDGGDTVARCLEAQVSNESFYWPANQLIFSAIVELYQKGQPVTIEVLAEELTSRRVFEQVGGFPYLTQVTGKIPTTAHAGYFIEKVREKHLLRELIKTATGAIEQAYSVTGGLDDFFRATRASIEAAVSCSATRNEISAVTAADLCAKPPPTPPEIVQGLIYRGGTGMISAPSKGHKTYTMLDLACAVALGREWLGFKTTATAALYVNLELAGHSCTRRLSAICAARGIKPPANLHILNLRGKRITAETLHNVIVPLARKKGAGLIILDPYYKISSVSGVEENSNDGQAVFLASVDNAADKTECAIVMVHHFAKGDAGAKNSIDRASGGGVQARWPDVFATLTEHDTEDCMVAEFHLRDFAPVPPFVVRWECPVWVREDGEDPAKLKSRAGPKERHSATEALEALGAGLMTNSEWHKATKLSDSTFRRKRDALLAAGKVEQVGNCYRAKQ